MRSDKNLLSNVLGFVRIPRERQRPAENGRVVPRYQGRERRIVTSGRQGDQLYLESVRRPIDIRRRALLLVALHASLVEIHRKANIWL
jgi:hypothetical protein